MKAGYEPADDASVAGDASLDDRESAAEGSLLDDVYALIEDGRLLAETELDFQRKRALYGASQAKTIAILVVAAAVFAFFGIMALVFGLVLALGQVMTYWGSTAVVAGFLFAVAFFALLRSRAKLARTRAVLTDKEGMG